MNKRELASAIKFTELKELKALRFPFVTNEILRENIAIKMQYIVFLVSFEEEYELPGAITYSAFKTIILFTASIVESLINYKLHELINSRTIDDTILGTEEKFTHIKTLHQISPMQGVFGGLKTTIVKELSDETNFLELNRGAKRSGLFTEDLFNKAERLRTMRNRIHPYALKEVDDKYSKQDIDDVFSTAKDIIERIETY